MTIYVALKWKKSGERLYHTSPQKWVEFGLGNIGELNISKKSD